MTGKNNLICRHYKSTNVILNPRPSSWIHERHPESTNVIMNLFQDLNPDTETSSAWRGKTTLPIVVLKPHTLYWIHKRHTESTYVIPNQRTSSWNHYAILKPLRHPEFISGSHPRYWNEFSMTGENNLICRRPDSTTSSWIYFRISAQILKRVQHDGGKATLSVVVLIPLRHLEFISGSQPRYWNEFSMTGKTTLPVVALNLGTSS
jgi:hypothetical protein